MAKTQINAGGDVARNETLSLIASDKVEGTVVYGADQNQIGQIENVMIDKTSGHVAYAVLSFGGFLGIGADYYPLPWAMLKYDPGLGGYLINLTADRLKPAPKYGANDEWNWNNAQEAAALDAYYRPFAFI
jgi:hypothetical protein